jgi:hypothetical protein
MRGFCIAMEQVDEKLVAAHIQQHLPPDERKARAQLQQEFGDMLHQGVFDRPLASLAAKPKKIQTVRVLQRLASQIGLRLASKLVTAVPVRY